MKPIFPRLAMTLALPALALAAAAQDSDTDAQAAWDPNGNVPPGSEPYAEYYINPLSTSNALCYYPLTLQDDTNPPIYVGTMEILTSDFKIYSKNYWLKRGTSGYNGNDYIYGSGNSGNGVTEDVYKQLNMPDNNLCIEGGGVWYGVQVKFYPQGNTTSSTTPGLLLTGGKKGEPTIEITATGSPRNLYSGDIDFTIHPGGIVNADSQKYIVTVTYDDEYGREVTATKTVTGLTGSFEGLGRFANNTSPEVLVSVITDGEVPYTNNYNWSIVGYKELGPASDVVTIKIPGVYLIGNIEGNNFDPTNPVRGIPYSDIQAGFPDADMIVAFTDLHLTGGLYVRFVSGSAGSWSEMNSSVTQYYPASDTNTACEDFWSTTSQPWYPYKTRIGETNSNWYPMLTEAVPASEGNYYNAYCNLATGNAAMAWSYKTTGISALDADEAVTPADGRKVEVYNMQGTLLRTADDAAAATIGLPSGIYVVDHRKIAIP